MFRVKPCLWILLVVLLLSGQSPPTEISPAKQPTPQSAGNAPDALSAEEASALCLADPLGAAALDTELRAYQRQVHSLPQKADMWVLVGRAWIRKARLAADPGFYVNVAGCVDAALRVAPEHLTALELRGLVLMNAHKFAEARQVAADILTKEPRNTIALGTLSDALLELGEFDMAATVAQQFMDIRPDMASYSRASHFRWLQGDTQNAKLFIRYALQAGKDRRDPEPTAWTFVQAAMLFWHEGDYDGADAVFAEALKWLPDYPAALMGRARVALSQGQPERAIEPLETAYRINSLPETAWLLGDARAMLGDAQGAQTEYAHTIRQGEKSDRLTLAYFYAVKNRTPEEALRLIETERRSRGGIYIDDTYAWALYRAGRLAEARQASDRALRLGTQDARLFYHAGAIRLAAGDHDGRKLIERALALNPQFDWTGAAEARKLLEAYDKNGPESSGS